MVMTTGIMKHNTCTSTKTCKNNLVHASPFVKWAGGKRQIVKLLEGHLPPHIKQSKKIEKYVEPFVGGGAFFFYLRSKYNIQEAIVSDINKDLIICYRVVQKSPKELIDILCELEQKFLSGNHMQRRDLYYMIRDLYNNLTVDLNSDYNTAWVIKSAYFIFLNRTCYNGLYRVNKDGKFNVPFGNYKNPKICNELNILHASEALRDVQILHGDFENSLHFISENTLAYLDPPYFPISKTSNFTNYSEDGFTIEDQIRLSKFFRKIHEKGAFVMLSNSASPFIENLYAEFYIVKIQATRFINCKPERRLSINEVLIKNY